MTNFDLSLQIFSFLKQAEVKEIVVCAGARNAPLVLALKSQNFKIYSYFEERSAAFFALGLMKAFQRPVAVMTTSGTAVAELLPATIEAYYQGLPLILISADRPKTYRGTGAPQSIEQVGLLSNYVDKVYDLDLYTQDFTFDWNLQKPLHLNVCFDEPLIDQKSDAIFYVKINKENISSASAAKAQLITNPLIILGQIEDESKERVIDFIVKTKAPVYAEALSQLSSIREIQPYLLKSSDVIVKKAFKLNLCDSVIRIGGVPTLRFWRDLEQEFKNIPVVNYSELAFTGLSRPSDLLPVVDLKAQSEFPEENLNKIKNIDHELSAEKRKLLEQFPQSEQSFTHVLSRTIKTSSLYLGNSLPIRNWDQFAEIQSEKISANRGANGIDGQISTYLGWSENFSKSFCFIGDLTAMYDLAALGLKPLLQMKQRNIVVCNNFGGQIFKRVFKNDEFINAHNINFEHWAKMWNWQYTQIKNTSELEKINSLKSEFNIIELQPNAEQTQWFWQNWDEKCQKL